MFLDKTMPTVTRIYERLTCSEAPLLHGAAWTWSRSTLHRFMGYIGYCFNDRKTHYEYTKERTDSTCKRENYIDCIKKYRNEGVSIFYQDETWVFKNIDQSKRWLDTQSDEVNYQVPSGTGPRSLISHLGSNETGLLEGCLLLSRGRNSNKDADNHTDMNADMFQK